MKIIVHHDEQLTASQALMYAREVTKIGFVSKDDTQFCFVTTFHSGITVFTDKTKTGTHVFRVQGKEAK